MIALDVMDEGSQHVVLRASEPCRLDVMVVEGHLIAFGYRGSWVAGEQEPGVSFDGSVQGNRSHEYAADGEAEGYSFVARPEDGEGGQQAERILRDLFNRRDEYETGYGEWAAASFLLSSFDSALRRLQTNGRLAKMSAERVQDEINNHLLCMLGQINSTWRAWKKEKPP